MKFHEFKSYDEYVASQRKMTLRKIKRENFRPFIKEETVLAIKGKFTASPIRGLCHGVRDGSELELFEEHIHGEWIGSEIVEELCDGIRVFHADFSCVVPEWVGAFDVVYSNSLDHSRIPEKTVSVWLDQLNVNGRLVVEWTKYSNRLSRRGKADCWAAGLDEYRELLNSLGVIESEESIFPGKHQRILFFVSKQGPK